MALLDGRHALITGGGSGIGAAIAVKLARRGRRRVARGPAQRRRSTRLRRSLPRAKAIVADVTSEAETNAMVAAARAAHGPIDILIANAGAAESAPAAKVDLAHWQRMLDVNLTGAFLSVKAALPDIVAGATLPAPDRLHRLDGGPQGLPLCRRLLRRQAWRRRPRPRAGGGAGAARRHGQRRVPGLHGDAAARSLARQHRATRPGGRAPRRAAELARLNPQGRFIEPEEVAETVLWLCTPAAQAINGQAISVSGGEI